MSVFQHGDDPPLFWLDAATLLILEEDYAAPSHLLAGGFIFFFCSVGPRTTTGTGQKRNKFHKAA